MKQLCDAAAGRMGPSHVVWENFTPWDAASQTHPVSGARERGGLGLQLQHWGAWVGVLRCSWAGESQGKATALYNRL